MRKLCPGIRGLLTVAGILVLASSAVAEQAAASLPATSPATAPAGRQILVSLAGAPVGDGSAERPLDIATAFSASGPAKPGDTILLAGAVYEGPMKDIERLPFVLAVSGLPDKPIALQPVPGAWVHLNGTLQITGSHMRIANLEIGDLKWDRTGKTHKNGPAGPTWPSSTGMARTR